MSFEEGDLDMQPLSKVRRGADVSLGVDDVMASRLKVALKIAECIAKWAVPIWVSTMPGVLGDFVFRFAFFIRHSAVDELEKAIPPGADVSIDVRMERRLARRHQNPIFAFDVRWQAGPSHSRQAQCAVAGSSIYVVSDFVHRRTITTRPNPAIATAV
jgi:hypothetical protein